MPHPAVKKIRDWAVSFVLLSLLLSSGLYCFSRKKPAKGEPDPPYKKAEHLPQALRDEMVLVQTPRHAFYIDRYEVAELAPNDFFSARNQEPRTALTIAAAKNICRRYKKRLCTIYEWRHACLGLRRKKYSYGNLYAEGFCNVNGKQATPAGEKTKCRTDAGVHDMVGNVMEWASAGRGDRAVALGGSFMTGKTGDCLTVIYLPRNAANNQIGFRCCL